MPKLHMNRRQLLASVAGTAILSATGASAGKHAPGILITKEQLTVARDGRVEIDSEALANALQKDRAATLEFLQKELPALDPKDIEIDRAGRIVVNNRDVGQTLDGRIKELADINVICGAGC